MDLIPKKIYEDFCNNHMDKSSTIALLLSIIENYDDNDLRIESIDLLDTFELKDEETFKFFESLLISDLSEEVRNRAALYIHNNFLDRASPPLKWAIQHEKSYNCLITIIKTLEKINLDDIKLVFIEELLRLKKAKHIILEKKTLDKLLKKAIKQLFKKHIEKLTIEHLADLLINYITIIQLAKTFPNFYFKLNSQSGLIDELDLSDFLEYEVKGTPWGWKNNIKKLSDITGLKYLIHLKKLDLSNNLIRNIEEIIYLVNLSHLILTNNKISDIKNLSYLKKLPKLKYLDIDGNKISSKIKKDDFDTDIQLISDRSYIKIK